jgi:hypothetical protein
MQSPSQKTNKKKKVMLLLAGFFKLELNLLNLRVFGSHVLRDIKEFEGGETKAFFFLGTRM